MSWWHVFVSPNHIHYTSFRLFQTRHQFGEARYRGAEHVTFPRQRRRCLSFRGRGKRSGISAISPFPTEIFECEMSLSSMLCTPREKRIGAGAYTLRENSKFPPTNGNGAKVFNLQRLLRFNNSFYLNVLSVNRVICGSMDVALQREMSAFTNNDVDVMSTQSPH